MAVGSEVRGRGGRLTLSHWEMFTAPAEPPGPEASGLASPSDWAPARARVVPVSRGTGACCPRPRARGPVANRLEPPVLAAGSFQEGDRRGPCCAWDVPEGLMVRGAASGRKRCRDMQVRLASAQLPSATN